MNKILLLILLLAFCIPAGAQNCTTSIIKFQTMGECEGKDIQLIASPINPGSTYQWSCPNQVYNSTTGPFLYIPWSVTADGGNYSLTVTDSAGCVSSALISVIVHPKPIVSISGQAFACLGDKTNLYANDLSGNYAPYTYSWDNGLTTKTIKILHSGGMAPHPSCIITNVNGCSASNQTAFMIGTIYPPFASISYSGLTSFCAPSNIELQAPVGGQFFYQWRKNGVDINGATNANYKATSTGKYKVILSDIYGCSDTSDYVPVTVFPRPSSSISVSGPLSFCNGDSVMLTAPTGAGYAYQWKKNGIPVSGANTKHYVANNAGNYRVVVTNNNDCSRLSAPKAVSIICKEGIQLSHIQDFEQVLVYPNPSAGQFTVRFPYNFTDQSQIKIFDILGNLVFISNAIPTENTLTFGEFLVPGIYTAHISQNNHRKIVKLIKGE